jgi:hypothetical protein
VKKMCKHTYVGPTGIRWRCTRAKHGTEIRIDPQGRPATVAPAHWYRAIKEDAE